MRFLSFATKVVQVGVYGSALAVGALIYLISGTTPSFAYQSMIKLFCVTSGLSNDFISRLIGVARPPYALATSQGVLFGSESSVERVEAIQALRQSGYHVFNRTLPSDVCDRLLSFAENSPSTVCPMDGEQTSLRAREVYARGAPRAVRYDFEPQDLLANEDVQALLADPSLLYVAQEYLGAKPVIDVLTMWWLTDFSATPDAMAAQYYHFDMDRPKWLKFFIYLTDVVPTTGPHTFVQGSHRSGGIPGHILDRGYARLSDADISSAYGTTDAIEIVAPRGSILAEDTRGLHKGKQVIKGDRLLLQIQFSNSLFGGRYPRISSDRSRATAPLKSAIEKFPRLYSAYFAP